MTTWRESIGKALISNDETWKDVESNTLTKEELDISFFNGWGAPDGKPFTLWTKNRVYFPVCYDGKEWVSSVSRNPDGKPTKHVGGY